MKNKLLAYILTVLFLAMPFSSMAGENIQIKIAVLPWKVNSAEKIDYVRDALYDMLSSRMAVEKNLVILKESDVRAVFSKYEKEKITDEILKKIGMELGADYVLYGSITYISETLGLDAKVLSIKREEQPIRSTSQGKGMESLIPIVSQLTLDLNSQILGKEGVEVTVAGFGAAPSYVGGFTKKDEIKKSSETDEFIITTRDKTKEKPLWKSHTFAGNLKKMDAGDVDGDGKNEIVLIDDHNLYIYRVRGQTMDIVKEFKGEIYEDNYSVDVADLNGNNIPEIYVSRISSRVDSYVIEYQNGEYVKILQNLPWFFKTASTNSDTALMGQKLSGDNMFYRDVKYLFWKEGKIAEKAGVDMPEGLNIYNFVKLPLVADKGEDTIAYTERDYLMLYRKDDNGKWRDIWTSKEYFGGSLSRIILGNSRGSAGATEGFDFVDIKSRIIYGDLDGDGNIEIIVNKNEGGALSRYFKKADSYKNGIIANLSWEKGGFEENWKTKKIDGYIADFIIKDIDNDGQKELVIIVVEGTNSKTPKSYLIAYKLNIQ